MLGVPEGVLTAPERVVGVERDDVERRRYGGSSVDRVEVVVDRDAADAHRVGDVLDRSPKDERPTLVEQSHRSLFVLARQQREPTAEFGFDRVDQAVERTVQAAACGLRRRCGPPRPARRRWPPCRRLPRTTRRARRPPVSPTGSAGAPPADRRLRRGAAGSVVGVAHSSPRVARRTPAVPPAPRGRRGR